ncbi:hypothetical protein [Actinoplanes sp. G11-F43]|uniref:hypothetical protein n=1 Tax=Actinoplanes sp. G11-F43 TaxID=3424130 RepID=UPI003D32A026
MSYPELRHHALRIEELVLQRTLDQLGIALLADGRAVDKTTMAAIPADAVAGIRGKCAGIAEMFEPFLDIPDPQALEAMHQKLVTTTSRLATASNSTDPIHGLKYLVDPDMNRARMVDETLTHWRGLAGQEFKRTLQEDWPAVIQNQFSLLSVLAGTIGATKALWEQCRTNVDSIAHQAITALQRMGEDTSVDAEVIILTVASSVLAVGATLTGGAGAVALTAAGAAAQVGATVVDKSAPEVNEEIHFDAVSPMALVEQLQQALFKLQFIVLRKEEQIATALIGSGETVTALRSSFVTPRPLLADQTNRTIMTDQGLGDFL